MHPKQRPDNSLAAFEKLMKKPYVVVPAVVEHYTWWPQTSFASTCLSSLGTETIPYVWSLRQLFCVPFLLLLYPRQSSHRTTPGLIVDLHTNLNLFFILSVKSLTSYLLYWALLRIELIIFQEKFKTTPRYFSWMITSLRMHRYGSFLVHYLALPRRGEKMEKNIHNQF